MKKLFWIILASITMATLVISCDKDEFPNTNDKDDIESPTDSIPNDTIPSDTVPADTGSIQQSDIQFELKCSDITGTSVKLAVYPSNDTIGYYYDMCTEEVFNKNEGDINHIIELYMNHLRLHNPDVPMAEILKNVLSWGPDEDIITGLPVGTKFYFYAVAINNDGKICSEPEVITFETLPKGNPAECTFEFELSSLTATSVQVNVKPSDSTIPYFMFIVPKNEFPGDYGLMAGIEQSFVEFAKQQNSTVEQVVQQVTCIGEHRETFNQLTQKTAYYVYAFPINEKGASVGEVSKKMFTTVDTGYSNANIQVDYKFFDGDELSKADPIIYGKMAGRVYVQATITPNSSADHWFIALAKNDLSDKTTYPDESNKDALARGGKKDVTKLNLVADWTTCTFLYFAIDEMGIDGPLTREVITFTKENASPIGEVIKTPVYQAPLLELVPAKETGLSAFLKNIEIPSKPVARNLLTGYRIK